MSTDPRLAGAITRAVRAIPAIAGDPEARYITATYQLATGLFKPKVLLTIPNSLWAPGNSRAESAARQELVLRAVEDVAGWPVELTDRRTLRHSRAKPTRRELSLPVQRPASTRPAVELPWICKDARTYAWGSDHRQLEWHRGGTAEAPEAGWYLHGPWRTGGVPLGRDLDLDEAMVLAAKTIRDNNQED